MRCILEIRSHSETAPSLPARVRRAAVACALLILPVSSAPAQSEMQIVPLYQGVGSHYSTPLSNPLGIYFDPVKRECYVADTGNGQVVVFNAAGMPVYRFTHFVPGRDGHPAPGEPRSLVVDAAGAVYLVDAQAPFIDVLDPRGRSITRVDAPDDACGQPERFVHLAINSRGAVCAITACRRPRVVELDADHAIARVFVLKDAQNERACVNGFALDAAGRIYVTNACASLMVRIYSPEGEFIRAFGKHDAGFENFAVPAGIAVMRDGRLWIVDTIRQVVSCFDQEGNLLTMMGGKGSQPGAFEYPSAVATDGESRLFVLERQGNRYQCLQINSEGVAAREN